MTTYEAVHMPRINVLIVRTAERYGWNLIWRNMTDEEIEASAGEGQPGSDSACPLYGVHATLPSSPNEPLLLWWMPGIGVVRDETHAEARCEAQKP